MNRKPLLRLLLLFFLALFAVAGNAQAGDDLKVVVSIKPIHSVLAALMKGVGNLELLVSAGRTPYEHELGPEQEQALAEADLVVWVGPELEGFLVEPLERLAKRARVITLLDSDALKILPSRWNEGERDPYFWLDTRNMLILVDELTQLLMERDPVRTHVYRRNRDALMKRLGELDRRLEYGYRGLKGGVILETYDTLQYFQQAYALRVGAVLSPRPGVPVKADELLKQHARLVEGEYACVVTEARMKMPEWPLLMKGVKVPQAELDSFGTRFQPGEDLYLKVMEYNTRVLKECIQPGEASTMLDTTISGVVVPHIGGRFMLIDHQGRVVTPEEMKGKFALIYFGYTYCPDVCPTSLQVMSAALKKLGPLADRIQPWFITVDPERDTQEVLAGYVTYFDKRLIGLTGSKAMIQRVLEEFGVTAEKVPDKEGDPGKYLVDHSASLYLMAPDGRYITQFAHGITPDQLAEKLREYVR